MKKLFGAMAILFLLFSSALACPGCAATNNNSNMTVYFLMGFIALTSVPFFVIYRTIIRYKKKDASSSIPGKSRL